MELLQLKYFKDAAELENFSKVAAKYYVPQSSISHTIARLEEELAVKLFTRNGKRVMLNESGRAFYEEISAALLKIDKGIDRVHDLRHNTVRISLLQGTVALIPLISEFSKANPDIGISFANPSEKQRGNLFFDVRIASKPSVSEKDCECIPLFTERILVAVASNSPLANKTSLCFEDIKDQKIVGLYPTSALNRLMSSYFSSHEYTPNIIIESENHATVAQFVKAGYGIAFYPEISWSEVGAEGIVSLPLADCNCRRTVYCFVPRDYEPSDATKRFIEFAVAWFK